MTAADLSLVLQWRNDPRIRQFMVTQHEISLTEHSAWFARASVDPSRRLLLLEDLGSPVAYVQLSSVKPGGVADWGFYASPDAPRGTGSLLGRMVLDYAFLELGLHKVCGQALEFNTRSIALHERLGFVREGVMRDQHLINGQYHAYVCFGLLQHEWRRD